MKHARETPFEKVFSLVLKRKISVKGLLKLPQTHLDEITVRLPIDEYL